MIKSFSSHNVSILFPQFHPKNPPHKKRTLFSPNLNRSLKCSASLVSGPTGTKPAPAEVSRTIMELASVGTLSTLTRDGWPLAFGVRCAVDGEGTPVVCVSGHRGVEIDRRSSLHVQLGQCGVRTPQCTIQGSLEKPQDTVILKKLCSIWKKRFEEEANEDLIHVVTVDRVLQIGDFQEDGIWLTPADYRNASPDPLRDVAGRLVNEINTNSMEDVLRFCSIFVDLPFQVSEAKTVWVDRLGFDVHVYSPEHGIYEVRIPFPREVTDEKGVKLALNGMSQLAWEVEKYYQAPNFEKVKQLKQISFGGRASEQPSLSSAAAL
ncbi:hypothetical protein Drorol1_Dr00016883 [Drosera rotundifolia]